jgi:hypothetical protein
LLACSTDPTFSPLYLRHDLLLDDIRLEQSADRRRGDASMVYLQQSMPPQHRGDQPASR